MKKSVVKNRNANFSDGKSKSLIPFVLLLCIALVLIIIATFIVFTNSSPTGEAVTGRVIETQISTYMGNGLPSTFNVATGYFSLSNKIIRAFNATGGFFIYVPTNNHWYLQSSASKQNSGIPIEGTPTISYYDEQHKVDVLWFGDKSYTKCSNCVFRENNNYFAYAPESTDNAIYYDFESVSSLGNNKFLYVASAEKIKGETTKLNVHGKEYTIIVDNVAGSPLKATFKVDGITTTALGVKESFKIKEGLYIVVNDILTGSSATRVNFGIGEGKVFGGANTVSGKYGNAMNFDGTDDCIEAMNLNELPNDFSISTWVYLPTDEGDVWGRIVDGSKFQIRKHGSSTNTAFELTDNANTRLLVSTDFLNNKWMHLAAVKEGKTISYYRDGTKTMTQGNFTTEAFQQNASIYFGCRNPTINNNFFKGEIDELKIYKKALTAEDVKTINNSRALTIGQPVVGYSFPSSDGGRVNLWDAKGNLYVYNPNDKKWYDRTKDKVNMGLPADFKPVVGFYTKAYTGGHVYAFDSAAKLYVYNIEQQTWTDRTNDKTDLGLPAKLPTTGYFDPLDRNNSILWFGNQIYRRGVTEGTAKWTLLNRVTPPSCTGALCTDGKVCKNGVCTPCSATITCPTGKICGTNGLCADNPSSGCVDSDAIVGGISRMAFYTTGSVTYNLIGEASQTVKDTCTSTTVLKEYGCNETELIETTHTCPHNCIPATATEGAKCGGEPTVTCIDSDADETNNGEDKNVAGKVTTGWDSISAEFNDNCIDEISLTEYTCDEDKRELGVTLSCGESEICDGGMCIGGDVPPCVEDSGCDEGKICSSTGICIVGCREDTDCKEGEECNTNRNKCVALPEPGCKDNDECEDDEICNDDGECELVVESGCLSNDECEDDEICNDDGECEQKPSNLLVWILVIFLVLLIIATIGIIVYLAVAKGSKSPTSSARSLNSPSLPSYS